MVDTFINSTERNEIGSNACNRIRKKGSVPGIIYGHYFQNHNLEINAKELAKVIRSQGENALVEVEVNGITYPAMIKEIQRDIITRDIIHVDLQQIDVTEKIHTAIPVFLSGKENVIADGILQQQLPKVEVECLPGNVPKNITVDVSNLSIGDSLTISDVEFSEDFNILTEPEKVIVSVSKAEEIIEEDDDDEFVYETEEAQIVEEDDVEDHQ